MKFTTPLVLAALLGSSDAKVTKTRSTGIKCQGTNAITCAESRLLTVTVTKDACEDQFDHLEDDEHACESDFYTDIEPMMGALFQTEAAMALQDAVFNPPADL